MVIVSSYLLYILSDESYIVSHFSGWFAVDKDHRSLTALGAIWGTAFPFLPKTKISSPVSDLLHPEQPGRPHHVSALLRGCHCKQLETYYAVDGQFPSPACWGTMWPTVKSGTHGVSKGLSENFPLSGGGSRHEAGLFWKGEGNKTRVTKKQKLFLSSPPPPPPRVGVATSGQIPSVCRARVHDDRALVGFGLVWSQKAHKYEACVNIRTPEETSWAFSAFLCPWLSHGGTECLVTLTARACINPEATLK